MLNPVTLQDELLDRLKSADRANERDGDGDLQDRTRVEDQYGDTLENEYIDHDGDARLEILMPVK